MEEAASHQSAFMEMVDELHKLSCLYQLSLSSVTNFRNQLKMTKLFLNMVIHDFRNPTTSIKTSLQQAILKIKQIGKMIKKHHKFSKNSILIQQTILNNQIKFEEFVTQDCKAIMPEVQIGDHLSMRNQVVRHQINKVSVQIQAQYLDVTTYLT